MEEAFEVSIRALGTDGQGIGSLPSGKTCFVEGVFPGEICLCRLISESSKFATCEALSVTKESPSRVRPFEPVLGLSGGLPLAALSYDAQLEYKASKVRDCLARVGKISEEELDRVMRPIVPCDNPGRYRNHMQYAVKDCRIGLLVAGSDKLGKYDAELIEYEMFSKLRQAAEECFERAPTTLFSGLVMRGSERTNEILVEFVSSLSASHEIVIRDCASYLEASGMITKYESVCEETGYRLNGVLLRISPDKTSKRTRSGKRAVIKGVDYYDEIFCGRRLRVKAGSFFQVNTVQAERLAKLASEGIRDAKVFYDLYCGAGTLGIAVKREGQKVFGVESVSEAVESAKINRSLAFPEGGADELSFLCRDVLKTDFAGMIKAGKIEAPDAVIVDPPRKGLDAGVIMKIEELAPAKFAYVSCDPATLARDLKMLTRKYKLESVTPVDLFANAAHVETVAILVKRYGERMEYSCFELREKPELKDMAAEWFHKKWGVPMEAYLECMNAYLNKETEYGWYLCMLGDQIVGGLGVIDNDFHDRKDLSPNVCAVYTEEAHRGQGIAGKLLDLVVDDMKQKGVSPLYLVTDHTGFYERYGWEFYCMVQGDDEPEQTRLYIHR